MVLKEINDILGFDNIYGVKNLLAYENMLLGKNEYCLANINLINIKPISKIDDKKSELMIKPSEYLKIGGMLPEIKSDLDPAVKEFVNAQLTNECNRKLKSMIGEVEIDDYSIDRQDIIVAARTDERYLKFIELFDNFTDKESEIDDIDSIDGYKVEGLKAAGWTTPAYGVLVEQDMIPKNTDLEKGKAYRLTSNRKLYKLLKPKIEENANYEILVFTDHDNIYTIMMSVYGYPTIRKINPGNYFRWSIGNE